MVKKLITAADVLKMKGYNMTALNGTEILGIIGEYYLKHDLSDYFYIRSVRFVSYKSAPTNGFVNLSSMDEVVKLEKDNPDFFEILVKLYLPYLEWCYYDSFYWEKYKEGNKRHKLTKEYLCDFRPCIVIDEASEKAVVKFIKSIGGYRINKPQCGKYKPFYFVSIV